MSSIFSLSHFSSFYLNLSSCQNVLLFPSLWYKETLLSSHSIGKYAFQINVCPKRHCNHFKLLMAVCDLLCKLHSVNSLPLFPEWHSNDNIWNRKKTSFDMAEVFQNPKHDVWHVWSISVFQTWWCLTWLKYFSFPDMTRFDLAEVFQFLRHDDVYEPVVFDVLWSCRILVSFFFSSTVF